MRGLFIHDLGACMCAPIRFKQDPALVAALIGAGASIAGAGISSATSANMNAASREYDWNKTQDLMRFNHDESELARRHQSNLLSQNQAWDEYFYNQYNSPSAMRRQYSEAGYNPYLVEGQGISGGSVPSAQAPSSAQASAPSTGNPPVFAPDLSALNNVGDYALRAIGVRANSANQQSEALKNVADLIPKLHSLGYSDDEIRQVIQPFILSSQGINADSDIVFQTGKLNYLNNKVRNERDILELQLAKTYSAKERQTKLDMTDQLITESVAKIGLMASEGKVNDKRIEQISQDMVESLSRIYRNYAEGSKADVEGFQIMELLPYIEDVSKRNALKAQVEERETFGNKGIEKFDNTIFGKGLNVLLWYLGRAFGSTNTSIGIKK